MQRKVKEKKERKGVSQRVVVNVKVGDTKKKAKRKYTRRPKTTGDLARTGPTGIYSFTPAGIPPAPAYSIPSQMGLPALPDAFRQQQIPSGLSLEDVRKVGREQAIGLLKEAEPAIRMAIEDISQKRVNEAIMKSQGAEQRAELEKKFVIPVSKGPIALAKEKLPSITRMKGGTDMTPENFGVGMNEILHEIKQEPVSVGKGTMIDLTQEEPVEVRGFRPSEPVIKIEDEPQPKAKSRGRPVGSKNRPKDIILAEKQAKKQRKVKPLV